jgi:hypothetical protein
MTTPSVTPIQALGASALILLGAGIGVAQAFGLDLTNTQITALTGFATAFVSVAVAADAAIRHGRAQIVAAAVTAGKPVPKAKPKKGK